MKNTLNSAALSVLTLIALASVLISCGPKQDLVQASPAEESSEEAEKEEILSEEEMFFKGYRKGAVVHDPELDGTCEYQIFLNLTEKLETLEFPEDFKENGLEVYVKYSLQRRPQQCEGSQPVDIIDIKKIEER
ncbi:MAG: hypothetical protein HKN79_08525 [Flavobacteriales bacterium]|nr:hypothetical protein [Flavobacteriales bacterium]